MPEPPKEAVEAVNRYGNERNWQKMRPGEIVQAAAPAIRDDVFNQLRRAADALENDPAADPGAYVHDVECAILRSLRDGS